MQRRQMLSKLLNETGLDGLLRRKTIIIFVFIISKNWCVITAESLLSIVTELLLSFSWTTKTRNWHSLIIHLQWKWISDLNCLVLRKWQITIAGESWWEEAYPTANVLRCGTPWGWESPFSTWPLIVHLISEESASRRYFY